MTVYTGPRIVIDEVVERFGTTHILSISSVGKQQTKITTPEGVAPDNHFQFEFDDVTTEERAALLVEITDDQVMELFELFKTLPDTASVYIHCEAGVSRSTAVAYALRAYREKISSIEEALKLLKDIDDKGFYSRNAWPNDRITNKFSNVMNLGVDLAEALTIWKDNYVFSS